MYCEIGQELAQTYRAMLADLPRLSEDAFQAYRRTPIEDRHTFQHFLRLVAHRQACMVCEAPYDDQLGGEA